VRKSLAKFDNYAPGEESCRYYQDIHTDYLGYEILEGEIRWQVVGILPAAG
jgi:hypothetical protein